MPNNSAVGAPSDKGADTAQSVTEHCNHLPALNNKKTFPQLTAKKKFAVLFFRLPDRFQVTAGLFKSWAGASLPDSIPCKHGIYCPLMDLLSSDEFP